MDIFEQLNGQSYISLETFRKNGQSIKTPVWFVQEGEILFVRTGADSGKVKRIRHNGQVKIASCKMDGALVGDWFTARAREIKDNDTSQKVDRLLDRKYGLMKKLFALFSALQNHKYTVLEIKTTEAAL
jgi:uncharacterized protein